MNDSAAPKTKIMVVDDDITNLKFAKVALSGVYEVLTVPSAEKMLKLLDTERPALILLDINMPEMNGLEALRQLKANRWSRDIPVIFLTSRSDPSSEIAGLSLGAVDYIRKPFEPHILRMRMALHLTMENQKKMLELQKSELQYFNENLRRMVKEETEKVVELQGAILNTLADMVESRDDSTGGHAWRTQRWIEILITALSETGPYRDIVADWDVGLLMRSSQLHDTGKIAISDSILLKPGKLTPEEFEIMKGHVEYGVRIINRICEHTTEHSFLEHAKVFAGAHHEKWDGSGYPNGLRGEDIPLQGRLMAIADVYDALISPRPYKRAFSHDEAVGVIIEGSGTHFDPELVKIFRQAEGEFAASL
jgi:putative two-component system response regulator